MGYVGYPKDIPVWVSDGLGTLVEYQADISGVYERRPDKVFISLIRVFWPDMALISTISLVKKTRIRLIKTLSGCRS